MDNLAKSELNMEKITLFAAPGACSKVPTILLEEIGHPYQLELVRFMKGQHKSPEFKQLNPKGKIPALRIGDQSLTENPMIISYLNDRFPEAKLMPATRNELEKFQQMADLCFCSSTLHPIVTRIRMPMFFSAQENTRQVWEFACKAMDEYFQLVENRLAAGDWWYGDQWSAMDAYLYWVFWRVAGANYDTSPYPLFEAHCQRMELRPAVQRTIKKEAEMQQTLESEGLVFTPPAIK